MIDEEELNLEWTAALEDAGLPRERMRLYGFDESESPEGSGAVWFRPGLEEDSVEHVSRRFVLGCPCD